VAPGYDIGIITVIPIETAMIRQVLKLPEAVDGFSVGRGSPKIVSVQANGQGQTAASAAARRLTERYRFKALVLVGIGGGIAPDLCIGDVVVATRVVGYDLHKETLRGIQRRGQEWAAPSKVCDGINEFFIAQGEPAGFPGFRARAGLVGSGSAVIASTRSNARRFLRDYNDKVLVVDMESEGLAHHCHSTGGQGWVVVRGVSDLADEQKDDDHQIVAARNAAVVVRALVPHLVE
jgi:adenosylhomocysteine nucleosidase